MIPSRRKELKWAVVTQPDDIMVVRTVCEFSLVTTSVGCQQVYSGVEALVKP